jgi:hypothetical protein
MKTRMFISILILVLAVLIVAGSCASRQKAISEEDFFKVWSGTWINIDYGGDTYQKEINYPNGTYEVYGEVTSTEPGNWGEITLLDKWVDSKGNVWYRAKSETLYFSHMYYEMGKISDSGNTWEYIWAGEDYPIEEWEPDRFEYNYRIRYRQE